MPVHPQSLQAVNSYKKSGAIGPEQMYIILITVQQLQCQVWTVRLLCGIYTL